MGTPRPIRPEIDNTPTKPIDDNIELWGVTGREFIQGCRDMLDITTLDRSHNLPKPKQQTEQEFMKKYSEKLTLKQRIKSFWRTEI